MVKKRILWHIPGDIIGGAETLYATLLKYADHPLFEHHASCLHDISRWVLGKCRSHAQVHPFRRTEELSGIIDGLHPALIVGSHGLTLYAALAGCKKTHTVLEVVHGAYLWYGHNLYMPKFWTQYLIFVSETARRFYTSHAREHIPGSVIINGVDTEVFTPRKPLERCSRVIAYFGRMESEKRLTHIVDAFRDLNDPNACLHFVGGDRHDHRLLKRYVKAQNPPGQVRYYRHMDAPALHYAFVDIATVRSETEGFCNSAAEALATGTPLVCYNFGGILDHVEPGVIAVGRTQEEYAEKLREVYTDYDLRRRMREQGLNFIETQCNARLTAKKYLDTFTSLV